jgi:hypothetical protein
MIASRRGPALPHFRHRKDYLAFAFVIVDALSTSPEHARIRNGNTRPKAELPYSCGLEGIDGTYVRSPGENHLGDEECRFTNGTLKSY